MFCSMSAARFLVGKLVRSIGTTSKNANFYQSKRSMTIWYPDAKFEREFRVIFNFLIILYNIIYVLKKHIKY